MDIARTAALLKDIDDLYRNLQHQPYEYRMYGFVAYNLGTIHKGIQFAHAVAEYARYYNLTPDYINWFVNHKTMVILDGGTTNDSGLVGKYDREVGTLNQIHINLFGKEKVNVGVFYEEDLGDQLTAICFIADERVFNLDKYPDPVNIPYTKFTDHTAARTHVMDLIGETAFQQYVDSLGGDQAFAKRFYIRKFSKLAS